MWNLNEIIYRCSINLGSSHLLPEPVLGQPAVFQFTCQGPVAKVRGCIKQVCAWLSRAQESPDSCPEKTLAIWDDLSELVIVLLDGVGQARDAGTVRIHRSQLLPARTTRSSWDFEMGRKVSNSKEGWQAVETPELGRGRQSW